ncbi:MAG: hypothetical protein HYS33_07635 [Acidobacteria bacterium]|nr:hypothetical protein [Acidobacteriota bacterium]
MVGLSVSASPPHGAGGGAPSPPAAGAKDEGTFIIYLGGRQIGTEKFSIRTARNKVIAEAQIEMRVERDGKSYQFKTSPKLVLNANLEPETYAWNQKGSESSRLEVDFRASPARVRYHTVGGDADLRDFELPRGVIVLDDNVVHHYQLVVERFQLAAGKNQSFPAFIPQEALPGVLNVDDLGIEKIESEGGARDLQHLVVSTELARIDLWVDKDHRLQHVSIPGATLEAVRKK